MSTELKSCPFCGGEAFINTPIKYLVDGELVPAAYYVNCKKCKASNGSCYGEGAEEAIEAWNRRIEQ